MANCVTIIDRAVDTELMDCWTTPSDFTHILGSKLFEFDCLDGENLKGKPLLYEGVDCRQIGWAFLHECEELGALDALMEVCPGNWEQKGDDLLFFPCFTVAEAPVVKKEEQAPRWVDMLKQNPCQLLEELLQCQLELAKGGRKRSRQGFGRQYTYDIGDPEELRRAIAMAKAACAKCDPCNPCLLAAGGRSRRSVSLSK